MDRNSGADTPPRPLQPTTTVRRTGGGFLYQRPERFTDAAAAAAAYDTYRALPCDAAAHTATDITLCAEILKAAEDEQDAGGHGDMQQVGACGRRGGWLTCCEGQRGSQSLNRHTGGQVWA